MNVLGNGQEEAKGGLMGLNPVSVSSATGACTGSQWDACWKKLLFTCSAGVHTQPDFSCALRQGPGVLSICQGSEAGRRARQLQCWFINSEEIF